MTFPNNHFVTMKWLNIEPKYKDLNIKTPDHNGYRKVSEYTDFCSFPCRMLRNHSVHTGRFLYRCVVRCVSLALIRPRTPCHRYHTRSYVSPGEPSLCASLHSWNTGHQNVILHVNICIAYCILFKLYN